MEFVTKTLLESLDISVCISGGLLLGSTSYVLLESIRHRPANMPLAIAGGMLMGYAGWQLAHTLERAKRLEDGSRRQMVFGGFRLGLNFLLDIMTIKLGHKMMQDAQ